MQVPPIDTNAGPEEADEIELQYSPVSATGSLLEQFEAARPGRGLDVGESANQDDVSDDPDAGIVFWESPPASPTFLASTALMFDARGANESDNNENEGNEQHLLDTLQDSQFVRELSVQRPTFMKRNPTLRNSKLALAPSNREEYLKMLVLLRSEIADAKSPQILIPAAQNPKPNTSFMVLTSTHVANPSFDIPAEPIPPLPPATHNTPLQTSPPSTFNEFLKFPQNMMKRNPSPIPLASEASTSLGTFKAVGLASKRSSIGSSASSKTVPAAQSGLVPVPHSNSSFRVLNSTRLATDAVEDQNTMPTVVVNMPLSVQSLFTSNQDSKPTFRVLNSVTSPGPKSSFGVIRPNTGGLVSSQGGLPKPVLLVEGGMVALDTPDPLVKNLSSVQSNQPLSAPNRIPTAVESAPITIAAATSENVPDTSPPKQGRKPPPSPPKHKVLDLDVKFQLAKLCIEGSSLYGADPGEIVRLKEEGYGYLTELSSCGMANANYYLGKCFAEDGNYSLAFPAFLRAAKATFPEASYAAASCLEFGKGCPVSFLTAQYYYNSAAESGHLLAMHRMAVALLNGELQFQKDILKGLKWLEKCAEYAKPDVTKALAQYQLSQIYEHGIPDMLDPYHSLSAKFLHDSALQKHPGAMCRLAQAYETGTLGFEQDIRHATKLYADAADLGNPEALFIMADYHLKGLTIMDCGCQGLPTIQSDLTLYSSPMKEELIDVWAIPGAPTFLPTPATSPVKVLPVPSPPPTQLPKPHNGPCHFTALISVDPLRAFNLLNKLMDISSSQNSTLTRLQADACYALGYLHEHPVVDVSIMDMNKSIMYYEAASQAGNVHAKKRVAELKELLGLGALTMTGDSGDEDLEDPREAFRRHIAVEGGIDGIGGRGGEKSFGIVKARRIKKREPDEFEKKLEGVGMLNAPAVDLRMMKQEQNQQILQQRGKEERCSVM